MRFRQTGLESGQCPLVPFQSFEEGLSVDFLCQPQNVLFVPAIKALDSIRIREGLVQTVPMLIKEEILLEAPHLENVVHQIIRDFHQSQSVSDLTMDLKAKYGKHQDRQEAEQEGQDDLAPNLESGLLHGIILSTAGMGVRELYGR